MMSLTKGDATAMVVAGPILAFVVSCECCGGLFGGRETADPVEIDP